MTKKKVDNLFFQLFCEKNSDGTKHLRLRGRELYQRFGKRLTEEDMPALCNFLQSQPEVISVDLSYNPLGDQSMQILAENLFHQDNTLSYINLTQCDMNATGLKWISSSNFLKLQKICLLGNKFGTEGAKYIGQLIQNCPTLELLDIGDTDQTLDGIEAVLILVEGSNLKHLNISRIIPASYYSQYNDSTLAEDLGIVLKLNSSLEVLRLQKCSFDGHDIELLLGGLQVHKKLTMLDLGCNNIGNHGIEVLSKWLKARPKLIALRLPANHITTQGAQALALSLPFSRVRFLDLQNNDIEDVGLAEMLDSMRKSTQMRILYIWGNQLGDLTLLRLERMLVSGGLQQENIDVKVYYVDGKRCAALYPSNKYNNRSLYVTDYGFPPELKIVKRKLPKEYSKPRALIDVEFIDRYPSVDNSLV